MKAGIFIRVADELAEQLPSLEPHDSTPAHITLIYCDGLSEDQVETLRRTCAEACQRQGTFVIKVQSVDEFKNEQGQTIKHLVPESDGDQLQKLNDVLVRALELRGVEAKVYEDGFKPHITLAYLAPGETYKGPKPWGRFKVEALEVWVDGNTSSPPYPLKRPPMRSKSAKRRDRAKKKARQKKKASAASQLKPIKLPPKQVIVPGVFVDEDGEEFEVTEEDVTRFIAGIKEIQGDGFKICGFPDHHTSKITERLSEWVDFEVRQDTYYSPSEKRWKQGPTGWGTPIAVSESAAQVILSNDTSPIFAWNLVWCEKTYPFVITRLDHVHQGAQATKQYRQAAACVQQLRKASTQARAGYRKTGDPKMNALHALLTEVLARGDEVSAAVGEALIEKAQAMAGEGEEIEGMDAAAALSALAAAGDGEEDGDAEDDAEAAAGECDDDAEAGAEDILDELEDEIDEDELDLDDEDELEDAAAGSKKAAASFPTNITAKGMKPFERRMWKRELDSLVRAGKRVTKRKAGAPLSRKVMASVYNDFDHYCKSMDPDDAYKIVKKTFSLEVKNTRLAAASASMRKSIRRVKKPNQQTLKKREPTAADVTGKNNPFRKLR